MINTEQTKLYLQQYGITKKLIAELHRQFDEAENETEKRRIAETIVEKERIADEIYNFVFQLPNSPELVVIDLRYLNDFSVREVCRSLYIAKTKYFKLHKSALQKLTEMRENK